MIIWFVLYLQNKFIYFHTIIILFMSYTRVQEDSGCKKHQKYHHGMANKSSVTFVHLKLDYCNLLLYITQGCH